MVGTRLSVVERGKIEALWQQGLRIPQIAAAIGRDRTVVWRELTRNNSGRRAGPRHPGGSRSDHPGLGGVYRWSYSASLAQSKTILRRRRPKTRKLIPAFGGSRPMLGELVRQKLRQRWSPKQISSWLRLEYPDRPELQVSHETIYQAIFIQGRGSLRAEIARQDALRSGRTGRRPQSREAAAARSRKPWVVGFNISTRPAEAADRAVPGHWEGDLVIGARGSSAIVTLVERTTRFVMLGALPDGRTSPEVITVLATLMGRVPDQIRRSLTWDQGVELARHADFTLTTGCPVFFCDPHSPWQRGSNENTNGLLRQYFPRTSTNFREYTQDDLDAIARQLNTRPRQTLNWQNPTERLNELLVASTD
ncbi:IS30 family transposase [Leifsonia sp. NPDC056665]|uniref:IS30 family transposase n=1 Tax=Leifsonia sp. NPDC056665 TaxID=3345901 RepID=UPI0036C12CEA